MEENIIKMKADILKALAHPTRVKILENLREGERCVCEIIDDLGIEQSNVSQHLAVLKKLDIVVSRKDGLRVNYQVKHQQIFKLLDLLGSILLSQAENTVSLLKGLKRDEGDNTH
ncbi:transcriptional regulator, ArsR family [Desulfofarcimen acetoxidans DSM 771]|uniref:Transcriptional regulator, ArsR family n=1 Tax=Desulfofarcimen acetoxidans (strain ATCC 49208 / DSM 771 / KCTC 5769 / VKM B-1644 / 5575) TaxID=485916 RepID=C8W3U4_DESAS|nr:metalloregulator ArsR/SmtB family transcription factor [Desulfofarcimen acetoxidans]ACV61198.1 transcriptional regulator, ArsR family [Desulfofarcimen acetoxidans DSM 771]